MPRDAKDEASELLHKTDTDLDDAAIVAMVDLFAKDGEKARTYMQFLRDSLQKKWVRKELKEMNFVFPDKS